MQRITLPASSGISLAPNIQSPHLTLLKIVKGSASRIDSGRIAKISWSVPFSQCYDLFETEAKLENVLY